MACVDPQVYCFPSRDSPWTIANSWEVNLGRTGLKCIEIGACLTSSLQAGTKSCSSCPASPCSYSLGALAILNTLSSASRRLSAFLAFLQLSSSLILFPLRNSSARNCLAILKQGLLPFKMARSRKSDMALRHTHCICWPSWRWPFLVSSWFHCRCYCLSTSRWLQRWGMQLPSSKTTCCSSHLRPSD